MVVNIVFYDLNVQTSSSTVAQNAISNCLLFNVYISTQNIQSMNIQIRNGTIRMSPNSRAMETALETNKSR